MTGIIRRYHDWQRGITREQRKRMETMPEWRPVLGKEHRDYATGWCKPDKHDEEWHWTWTVGDGMSRGTIFARATVEPHFSTVVIPRAAFSCRKLRLRLIANPHHFEGSLVQILESGTWIEPRGIVFDGRARDYIRTRLGYPSQFIVIVEGLREVHEKLTP